MNCDSVKQKLFDLIFEQVDSKTRLSLWSHILKCKNCYAETVHLLKEKGILDENIGKDVSDIIEKFASTKIDETFKEKSEVLEKIEGPLIRVRTPALFVMVILIGLTAFGGFILSINLQNLNSAKKKSTNQPVPLSERMIYNIYAPDSILQDSNLSIFIKNTISPKELKCFVTDNKQSFFINGVCKTLNDDFLELTFDTKNLKPGIYNLTVKNDYGLSEIFDFVVQPTSDFSVIILNQFANKGDDILFKVISSSQKNNQLEDCNIVIKKLGTNEVIDKKNFEKIELNEIYKIKPDKCTPYEVYYLEVPNSQIVRKEQLFWILDTQNDKCLNVSIIPEKSYFKFSEFLKGSIIVKDELAEPVEGLILKLKLEFIMNSEKQFIETICTTDREGKANFNVPVDFKKFFEPTLCVIKANYLCKEGKQLTVLSYCFFTEKNLFVELSLPQEKFIPNIENKIFINTYTADFSPQSCSVFIQDNLGRQWTIETDKHGFAEFYAIPQPGKWNLTFNCTDNFGNSTYYSLDNFIEDATVISDKFALEKSFIKNFEEQIEEPVAKPFKKIEVKDGKISYVIDDSAKKSNLIILSTSKEIYSKTTAIMTYFNRTQALNKIFNPKKIIHQPRIQKREVSNTISVQKQEGDSVKKSFSKSIFGITNFPFWASVSSLIILSLIVLANIVSFRFNNASFFQFSLASGIILSWILFTRKILSIYFQNISLNSFQEKIFKGGQLNNEIFWQIVWIFSLIFLCLTIILNSRKGSRSGILLFNLLIILTLATSFITTAYKQEKLVAYSVLCGAFFSILLIIHTVLKECTTKVTLGLKPTWLSCFSLVFFSNIILLSYIFATDHLWKKQEVSYEVKVLKNNIEEISPEQDSRTKIESFRSFKKYIDENISGDVLWVGELFDRDGYVDIGFYDKLILKLVSDKSIYTEQITQTPAGEKILINFPKIVRFGDKFHSAIYVKNNKPSRRHFRVTAQIDENRKSNILKILDDTQKSLYIDAGQFAIIKFYCEVVGGGKGFVRFKIEAEDSENPAIYYTASDETISFNSIIQTPPINNILPQITEKITKDEIKINAGWEKSWNQSAGLKFFIKTDDEIKVPDKEINIVITIPPNFELDWLHLERELINTSIKSFSVKDSILNITSNLGSLKGEGIIIFFKSLGKCDVLVPAVEIFYAQDTSLICKSWRFEITDEMQ